MREWSEKGKRRLPLPLEGVAKYRPFFFGRDAARGNRLSGSPTKKANTRNYYIKPARPVATPEYAVPPAIG
jgi:hypothetical protein